MRLPKLIPVPISSVTYPCQVLDTGLTLTTWPAGPVASSGRAGVHHQDLPAARLLPGRTPHPQGPSPHPSSSPELALAKPVRQRLARLRALPLPPDPAHGGRPIRRAIQLPRGSAPKWPPRVYCRSLPLISPVTADVARQYPLCAANPLSTRPNRSGSTPRRPFPHPSFRV